MLKGEKKNMLLLKLSQKKLQLPSLATNVFKCPTNFKNLQRWCLWFSAYLGCQGPCSWFVLSTSFAACGGFLSHSISHKLVGLQVMCYHSMR